MPYHTTLTLLATPQDALAGRRLCRCEHAINGHDVHPRYLMRLQKADGYAYAR